MSTAPTLPFVSVEEYLRTDYEPNCEYLDGVLKAKSLPDRIHSALQEILLAFLRTQRGAFPTLKGRPELHNRITPTRFRIPDIAGILGRPTDGRYPSPDAPPVFTIEIASKDEPWSDLRGKMMDHLAMGVGTVILADPYNRTVLVATASEPLRELPVPRVVSIPVPGYDQPLLMDFDELYRQLDEELS
jgi:Uma2 family endonuclease